MLSIMNIVGKLGKSRAWSQPCPELPKCTFMDFCLTIICNIHILLKCYPFWYSWTQDMRRVGKNVLFWFFWYLQIVQIKQIISKIENFL